MPRRDGYSNYAFFEALAAGSYDPGSSAVAGNTIDTRGYDTCTFYIFVAGVGLSTSYGGASFHQWKLEHGASDTAGSVYWSEVPPSQMLHSVVGMDGPYSTLNSGIFQSTSGLTGVGSAKYAVGYKGPRRWVRIYLSAEGNTSTMSAAAGCILGRGGDWPANSPVSSA